MNILQINRIFDKINWNFSNYLRSPYSVPMHECGGKLGIKNFKNKSIKNHVIEIQLVKSSTTKKKSKSEPPQHLKFKSSNS